jgi:hypothetical protein
LPAAPFGNYPTSGSTTNYSLTFEIWFEAAPESPGGVILSQANGGGYVPAVMLGQDGKIYSSLFWLGSGSDTIASSSTYNDGKWRLVDATYSIGTQSLYIDGVLIGTQSSPAPRRALPSSRRQYWSASLPQAIHPGKATLSPLSSGMPRAIQLLACLAAVSLSASPEQHRHLRPGDRIG